ncbi:hypothetical protein B0H14DRAFT_3872163 [Mycena olivaceomarginata]|nr:hypothetical protein B0H14DRAFT_3872163 [Mycena olivaceomarginata]
MSKLLEVDVRNFDPAYLLLPPPDSRGASTPLLARDVWGDYREADFQRKNLCRQYLHLLLLHPNAREARDVGTHLWVQASYAFIALNNGGGPVETRKLLQRFRQFLANEERFWRALVLRVQRAYGVVLPPHVTLPSELLGNNNNGNGAEEDQGQGQGGEDGSHRMNHFGFPAYGHADGGRARTAASVLSKVLVCLGGYCAVSGSVKGPAEGEWEGSLMSIFLNAGGKFGPGKGKMYLGEPRPNYYSRPRALYLAAHALSPEEGNAAHHLAILAGDYESDALSSVAWFLRAPFETAGENLAGVLARVLAAHRQQQQQGKTKNGAIEGGGGGAENGAGGRGVGRGSGRGRETGDMDGGESEEWEERNPPRHPRPPNTLAAHAAGFFARLVSACTLPEELIVRVVCVAQGVVWAGRMLAPPPGKTAGSASGSDKEKEKNGGGQKGPARRANRYARANRNRDKSAPAEPTTSASGAGVQNDNENDNERVEGREKEGKQKQRKTQAAHFAHLLGLHTALLGMGVRELGEVGVARREGEDREGREGEGRRGGRRGGEAPPVGLSVPAPGPGGVTGGAGPGKPELAKRISAEVRRTLPALRGGHQQQQRSAEEAELGAQREPFWATFAEFLRRLARAFSAVLLPKLSASVREGGEGGEGKDAEGPEGPPPPCRHDQEPSLVSVESPVKHPSPTGPDLTEKMKATSARRERPAPP